MRILPWGHRCLYSEKKKRQGTITEDSEETVRAVGKEPADRGGMKVKGEVGTFFSGR